MYLWVACLITLFLVGFIAFFRETPHYLFKMRKFSECHQHLRMMARYNRAPTSEVPSVGQLKIAKDGQPAQPRDSALNTPGPRKEKTGKMSEEEDPLILFEALLFDQSVDLAPSSNNSDFDTSGFPNYEHSITSEPKIQVPGLQDLWAAKKIRCNTAILALVWSASCYTFYFSEFYVRYIPTNSIYLLKILTGFADILGSFLYSLSTKYMSTHTSLLSFFGISILSAFALTTVMFFYDKALVLTETLTQSDSLDGEQSLQRA